MSAIAERKVPESKVSAKHLPPKGLVLRCIVFQNKTKAYTAECIDLDILVYGKTPHYALSTLRGAIASYLEVALTGDSSGLIPRMAPSSLPPVRAEGRPQRRGQTQLSTERLVSGSDSLR